MEAKVNMIQYWYNIKLLSLKINVLTNKQIINKRMAHMSVGIIFGAALYAVIGAVIGFGFAILIDIAVNKYYYSHKFKIYYNIMNLNEEEGVKYTHLMWARYGILNEVLLEMLLTDEKWEEHKLLLYSPITCT